jgi:hypothetical protein
MKKETGQRLSAKQVQNKIFHFWLIWNFYLRLLCMTNLVDPIYDLIKLNCLSKPIPYFPLHWVVLLGWETSFWFVELLEFFGMIPGVSLLRNHSFSPCLHRIWSIYIFTVAYIFIFVSRVPVFIFASKKIWKQLWHESIPSVPAPFFIYMQRFHRIFTLLLDYFEI